MRKIYNLSMMLMFAMVLASVTVYAQPAELVARYTFDEISGTVAADATGNGYDGIVSCDTCWGEGTIGGALAFWGTESVTLPADAMGMTSYDGSVAFWMKSFDNIDEINTMFWAGDNLTGGGFGNVEDTENELHIHLEAPAEVWIGGECSYFVIAEPNTFIHSDPAKGGNPGVAPVDPILLNDNEWHHIAATWGEGFVSMYIDGVVMWDTTLYNARGYDLTNMFLGQMANESRTFYGMLDDVRIYTGVLIDLDVEDLYNKDFTHVDPVSVDELSLSVFPNPAADNASLRFSSEAGKNVSVKLYSLTGALIGNVYEGISAGGENVIDLNTDDYPTGLYVVEMQIEDRVAHAKFVLQ